MDANTLAVALTVSGTIIVGALTFISQMNRNVAQKKAEQRAADVEIARLQDDIEKRLWAWAKAELALVDEKVRTLTTQLDAERTLRRDLETQFETKLEAERAMRRNIETRVNVLEQENRRLQSDNQALVAELASYTNRKL